MMMISKNTRKQKLKEHTCQYEGCGKVFFGIKVAKYCPEHRKPEYRIRVYKKDELGDENKIISHKFTEVQNTVHNCEHCNAEYSIKIFPRQNIYPRYCPLHRNEYKRAAK